VVIYYALINGYVDNVPVDKVRDFEAGLYQYLEAKSDVSKMILEKKELDAEIEDKIKRVLESYKENLDYLIN